MRRPSQSSSSSTGRDVEAEIAQPLLVLGLAEDGHVPRHEARSGLVEVVLVHVRDHDRVEAAHDLLGGKRERNERVAPRLRRVLDGVARARVVEHGLDEHAPAFDLEQERRVTYEGQAHRGFLQDRPARGGPVLSGEVEIQADGAASRAGRIGCVARKSSSGSTSALISARRRYVSAG